MACNYCDLTYVVRYETEAKFNESTEKEVFIIETNIRNAYWTFLLYMNRKFMG